MAPLGTGSQFQGHQLGGTSMQMLDAHAGHMQSTTQGHHEGLLGGLRQLGGADANTLQQLGAGSGVADLSQLTGGGSGGAGSDMDVYQQYLALEQQYGAGPVQQQLMMHFAPGGAGGAMQTNAPMHMGEAGAPADMSDAAALLAMLGSGG